jgi:hypothetical protein
MLFRVQLKRRNLIDRLGLRTGFSNAIKMYSLFLNFSHVEVCLQICVKCCTVVGETEKSPNGILVFKHNFDVYYVHSPVICSVTTFILSKAGDSEAGGL